MATVVVGGHARNVGKTSVIAALIAALPERNWTAFKISQHTHTDGVILTLSNVKGKNPRIPSVANHLVHICREHDPAAGTDSARYLAAGALRSFFVHGPEDFLDRAIPDIQAEIGRSENAVIESNDILRLLRPHLCLLVLNSKIADFKPSALAHLRQCDAIVHTGTMPSHPLWPESAIQIIRRKPAFHAPPPHCKSPELVTFVSQELNGRRHIP